MDYLLLNIANKNIKYNEKSMFYVYKRHIHGLSSDKWIVLGHSGARLNKIIFSTKPSGSVWATLSQIQ